MINIDLDRNSWSMELLMLTGGAWGRLIKMSSFVYA